MDWQALRNIFLQYLEDNINQWDKDFNKLYEDIIRKLKEEGYQITDEIDKMLYEFAQEKVENLKSLITDIAVAITDKSFKDPLVQKIVREVFEYRYPDGLNLSQRLWNWSNELQQGLKKTLKAALVKGMSADRIVYELQSTINSFSGQQKAIVLKENLPKWVKELKTSAKAVLKDFKNIKEFEKTINKLEKYINKLSKEGSYYSSKHLLRQIEKAVLEGKEYMIDKAIQYHIYNKQLTRLKTIARTESANVYHKAQIIMTEKDEDLIGYRWGLSKSHPKPDICDYLANLNYGLGRGIHPKDKVPREKAHPNCMCYLEPVYSFETKGKLKEFATINKKILRKFAPKYIKELERKGYDIKQFFDENRKAFIPKKELVHLFQ